MRAVLDTNVIVSGLLSPKGNARLVMAMAFGRKFDLILSEELLAEYETVLRRPKFRFRSDEIDEALTELRRVGEVMKPTRHNCPNPQTNPTIDSSSARKPDQRTTW